MTRADTERGSVISWTRDGSEPSHAPVYSQRSHVHHSDSLIAQETGKGKAINIFQTIDIFFVQTIYLCQQQDANKLGKVASLSTQSCQPEKKSVQENGQKKLQFPAFANVELHR